MRIWFFVMFFLVWSEKKCTIDSMLHKNYKTQITSYLFSYQTILFFKTHFLVKCSLLLYFLYKISKGFFRIFSFQDLHFSSGMSRKLWKKNDRSSYYDSRSSFSRIIGFRSRQKNRIFGILSGFRIIIRNSDFSKVAKSHSGSEN